MFTNVKFYRQILMFRNSSKKVITTIMLSRINACEKHNFCIPNYGNNTFQCRAKVKSCKEFLELSPSTKSGYYKIWSTKTQSDRTVYCDMETDGGGWMMVANVTIQTNTESLIYGDLDSFTKLQKGNFLLSRPYFKELNENVFQINEFRFFCHKPSYGRTVHIASTNHENSKEWVQYLISNIDELSCGSNCVDIIRRLSDDDSLLGSTTQYIYAREWTPTKQRVYEHQVYDPIGYLFNVISIDHNKRLECDDYHPQNKAGLWNVYIR